uniref:Transmembrane protein n=1 Tax=Medicago truncatula TaxID=3880 RepID=I3T1U6_MEDTR|nr:unknown [Medicago truncatula]
MRGKNIRVTPLESRSNHNFLLTDWAEVFKHKPLFYTLKVIAVFTV